MANAFALTKICITCAKPIPQAALKCTECDSYQDWRRYLGFSSTVLALLTALVSVVATSLPIFSAAITPANSNLSTHFDNVDGAKIIILATNSGARPGAVLSGTLTYTRDGVPHEFSLATPPETPFVQSGGGEKIELQPKRSEFIDMPRGSFDRNAGSCELTVLVQEFDGKKKPNLEDVECHAVEPIFIEMNPLAVTPYAEP